MQVSFQVWKNTSLSNSFCSRRTFVSLTKSAQHWSFWKCNVRNVSSWHRAFLWRSILLHCVCDVVLLHCVSKGVRSLPEFRTEPIRNWEANKCLIIRPELWQACENRWAFSFWRDFWSFVISLERLDCSFLRYANKFLLNLNHHQGICDQREEPIIQKTK